MKSVKLDEHQFKEYLSAEVIADKVTVLGAKINNDYTSNDPPIVIALLNGAFIFAADLCRQFDFECQLQLLRVSSYKGMESTGKVKIDHAAEPDMNNRHVIIVEDIVDTGNTLAAYLPTLKAKGAKSVKVCTLLLKPEAVQHDLELAYVGFEIPNEFVIGYGLDYNGRGRNLGAIYSIVADK
ncbi:hypoxanthine phosphoribosyltransferase [Saprospiraceae bacterium]|jgi:hypoxanthine phosphoribosyltransferase|nr:hypoxanthine phosphoribosyltransferase [bacterium]MDB4162516.1 hypoxanthine phosphoribosyltransferase [Saprospiraceae bacterium]MDB4824355.1 hypoxanthine phosphoribosyltransferase [Saprospiraceae bacterium]|tara:strand:- start:512 stop:1057 length:546 start_codon:yes stop_codon:yes gene_type:complete